MIFLFGLSRILSKVWKVLTLYDGGDIFVLLLGQVAHVT